MKKNRFSQFGEGLCRGRMEKMTGGGKGTSPKKTMAIAGKGKTSRS